MLNHCWYIIRRNVNNNISIKWGEYWKMIQPNWQVEKQQLPSIDIWGISLFMQKFIVEIFIRNTYSGKSKFEKENKNIDKPIALQNKHVLWIYETMYIDSIASYPHFTFKVKYVVRVWMKIQFKHWEFNLCRKQILFYANDIIDGTFYEYTVTPLRSADCVQNQNLISVKTRKI